MAVTLLAWANRGVSGTPFTYPVLVGMVSKFDDHVLYMRLDWQCLMRQKHGIIEAHQFSKPKEAMRRSLLALL